VTPNVFQFIGLSTDGQRHIKGKPTCYFFLKPNEGLEMQLSLEHRRPPVTMVLVNENPLSLSLFLSLFLSLSLYSSPGRRAPKQSVKAADFPSNQAGNVCHYGQMSGSHNGRK
jgi:hypothetical protein